MAPLMVTALLGFAVGPALGGTVAEMYGIHVPFFICAAGMATGSVSALVFLPETLRRKSGTAADNGEVKKVLPAWQQWRDMIKMAPIQGINGVTFMMGVLQGASPVTGILYATEVLEMSTGAFRLSRYLS